VLYILSLLNKSIIISTKKTYLKEEELLSLVKIIKASSIISQEILYFMRGCNVSRQIM
jgi:hypothetical protein